MLYFKGMLNSIDLYKEILLRALVIVIIIDSWFSKVDHEKGKELFLLMDKNFYPSGQFYDVIYFYKENYVVEKE